MTSTTPARLRPAVATMIACLALSAVLGTGSYAAGVLTGKDVKNGSLTGKDLKTESVTGKHVKNLTGADLDEGSLTTVPNAEHALTADKFGTVEPQDILTAVGCAKSKVHGYARVRGNAGSMPNTFTESSTFVDTQFNCSGSPVIVRRVSVGHYRVKFPANPLTLALVQVRTDNDAGDQQICAAVQRVTADGPDQWSFDVQGTVCGSDGARDFDFTIALP